jgi:hypothetical protein
MGILNKLFGSDQQQPTAPFISTSKEYKKLITDLVTACLKPQGFKHKGSTYERTNSELTQYISLQSSGTSTNRLLKLTVNIEMASSVLASFGDDRIPIRKHRHTHQRIGYYMNTQQDKWWVIDSEHSAANAANEIIDALTNKVLPELNLLVSTEDLVNRLKLGNGLGLTEIQHKHYLKLLAEQNIR